MLGSKISDVSENNSFAVFWGFFMNLRVREEGKEDDIEVGKSKVETGLQDSKQNHMLFWGWLWLI